MMKINRLMPFLVGAVPLMVKADAIHNGYPLVAQAQQQKPHKKGGLWSKLNLTDAQKQQMRQIEQDTKKQIEGVYKPDQLAKLQAAKSQRQQGQRINRRNLMQSLNLDEGQKAQIKQIREAQKASLSTARAMATKSIGDGNR